MSSVKLSKKMKKIGMEYKNGTRVMDWMLYLYLVAILGVYPWITDDKYFNITITRYKFFMVATFLYAALALVGYLLDRYILKQCGMVQNVITGEQTLTYRNPDFWMGAFLFAQLFAWVVAPDKAAAMTGIQGRRMGLIFFIAVALMYMVVSLRAKVSELFLMIFAGATVYAYVIAIFQHMGNDFMRYKERIKPELYDVFMSTFGNINIFASFLCISIPVFICTAVFSRKLVYRAVAMAVLVPGGMCIMIANSDSAYLGLCAAVLFIFFLAYKNSCVQRFLLAMICLAAGNLGVVLQNHLVIKEYDKRGGVAEALDRIDLAVLILLFAVMLYIATVLAARYCGSKLECLNKKHVIFGMLAVLCIIAVGVVCYGIHSGAALFTFNYKWGTYRGYIWTKCAELFQEAPIRNKLFGYGNESLKVLMQNNYKKEMLAVTGKIYDNAHNEVLQYLITTGIAGAVSYIGLCISSFAYILKRAEGRAFAYVSAAVMMGYFAQSMINVNQPITTPFFFVFMALGVGYVRVGSDREEACG